MKKGSTVFLRLVILLIAAGVLAVCFFVLPNLINSELTGDFDYGPIFLGLYIPAVPFFIALYHAAKLLSYIDQNKVFSTLAVTSLRIIKVSAFTISGLFAAGMPYIFYVADSDDAPGLLAVGLVIIFASFVVGTFGGVMQKLIQNGVELKSENDLTV